MAIFLTVVLTITVMCGLMGGIFFLGGKSMDSVRGRRMAAVALPTILLTLRILRGDSAWWFRCGLLVLLFAVNIPVLRWAGQRKDGDPKADIQPPKSL